MKHSQMDTCNNASPKKKEKKKEKRKKKKRKEKRGHDRMSTRFNE